MTDEMRSPLEDRRHGDRRKPPGRSIQHGVDAHAFEELHQSALDAQRRAHELHGRTLAVLAESGRVLGLAARGELGSGRLQSLIEENEGLRRAMQTRAVIEQAKGMVIATTGCTADEAFALLTAQSQHENRKLAQVAEDLVRAAVRAR